MIILPPKIRWTIIISALITMIISGMISAQALQSHNQKISTLKVDILNKKSVIQSLWQNILVDEHKAHLFVLYTLLHNEQDNANALDALNNAYQKFTFPAQRNNITLETLPSYLNNLHATKTGTINKIDDLYLEQQKLEDTITSQTQHHTMLMNIALFIQLLSLAIITIARDLK